MGLRNNNDDGNANAYVRKISAQAETDEKPIGRVKDMQRFLMDFEAKNKAEAKKHDFPQKATSNVPRPWQKKQQQKQQEEIRPAEKQDVEVVDKKQEDIRGEAASTTVTEPKKQEHTEEDGGDEDASLDDFGKTRRRVIILVS